MVAALLCVLGPLHACRHTGLQKQAVAGKNTCFAHQKMFFVYMHGTRHARYMCHYAAHALYENCCRRSAFRKAVWPAYEQKQPASTRRGCQVSETLASMALHLLPELVNHGYVTDANRQRNQGPWSKAGFVTLHPAWQRTLPAQDLPAYTAFAPSSSSMRISWLYLARRSDLGRGASPLRQVFSPQCCACCLRQAMSRCTSAGCAWQGAPTWRRREVLRGHVQCCPGLGLKQARINLLVGANTVLPAVNRNPSWLCNGRDSRSGSGCWKRSTAR